MNRQYILKGVMLPAMLTLAGCSDDFFGQDGKDNPSGKLEVRAEIEQQNPTRANDSGFAEGDAIGVYAVNPSESDALKPEGNYADNVKFTFGGDDAGWTGANEIYWPDENTPLNVYGYYPFDADMTDITKVRVSMSRNQKKEEANGMTGYEASDFLRACSENIPQSAGAVNLQFRHVMACVQVSLVEGRYFEPGEWDTLDKSVLISGTMPDGIIDMTDGTVTVTASEPQSIIPLESGEFMRAVVVPQTVASGVTLLAITVDGQSYNFTRDAAMEYQSGKMHKFTISVNKRAASGDYEFKLESESVTAWESDMVSHNGSTRAYINVDVPEGTSLREAIAKAGIDPAAVENLKVTGRLDLFDFNYIRENMKVLEALNLKNCTVWDRIDEVWRKDYLPGDCVKGMRTLKYFDFPVNLKVIGGGSFYNTSLTGSLILPEGLEEVGNGAFGGYGEHMLNLTGTLYLPSTLKRIGNDAFYNRSFTGELIIPENVEYIGGHAFYGCRHITGTLKIPDNVKYIGEAAFSEMEGISGPVGIPQGISVIPNDLFCGTPVSYVSLPEGVTEIQSAFNGSGLRGDIRLPKTLRRLTGAVFKGCEISHIFIPEGIDIIPEDCFSGCALRDTINIPRGVEVIDRTAFASCRQLEAVVIPATVTSIKDYAFDNCFSLSYIHCDAKEPPSLSGNAFNGVAKDNFTIEVPEGSVDKYRNAPGWREFKRITTYRGFVARPSVVNLLNAGGSRDIILNADDNWELVSKPDWCRVNVTSGYKKTALTLTVDAMAHGSGDRKGEVVFRLNDPEQHECHINVGQYDYEYDENQTLTLQSASTGNGVEVFIIGDGYDAADISSGLYLEDMKRIADNFFSVEPYTTYRPYFNVRTAIALSDESGIGTLNTLRRTKFNMSYGDGSSLENRIAGDDATVTQYANDRVAQIKANSKDATIVCLANADEYDGKTALYSNGPSISYLPRTVGGFEDEAARLVHHEANGHGFGKLADEYVYHRALISKCICSCCKHTDDLLAAQAIGWFRNVSLRGNYSTSEWRHLMEHPKYADIVDIFEGGYFHTYGVFTSEPNSCMSYNDPYFSTWSRQLIVENIMRIAGEQFNFEAFVAKDSRAWGSDGRTRTAAANHSHKGGRCSGAEIYKGSPLDKKNMKRKTSTHSHAGKEVRK